MNVIQSSDRFSDTSDTTVNCQATVNLQHLRSAVNCQATIYLQHQRSTVFY